ncbi:hypothetical protein BDV59DRAFT_181236 [Aspergillus ambiguus]|uniref:uncharacterized protein n=1 Tax=Aspergillus ambiguus TaxID=176160 RepID=UPI003CCE1FD3
MSSPEESPAQKAARLRRERREAKIKDGGAARLDKITSLSGRTPQNRDAPSPSPSPSPQPPASISPSSETPPRQAPPSPSPLAHQTATADHPPPPADLQAQQELLRSLLRQPAPSPGQQPSPPDGDGDGDDPMMKLLGSLMAGMPGGNEAGGPGAGGSAAPAPGMSPGDLAASLGVPPFVASMLGMATQPKSEAEQRAARTWKVLHVLFSIAIGGYLLFVVGSSIATFGSSPPPPATARNPFLFFTTGELLLTGARVMIKSRNGGLAGPGLYVQLVRDVVRDGSVVVFLLGMGAWWHRDWMVN